MIAITDLKTALLDLLHEVQDTDIKIIVGGGYGIYLKTAHERQIEAQTLLQEWPEPRSTNDLDLFLRPELLIESERLKPLANAIAKLGYQVVRGAENYQFVKSGLERTETSSLKIDFLTGPQNRFEGTQVKVDTRRAKPKPSVGIHAHPVDEALTLDKGLLPITLSGNLSSGNPWEAGVFIPHPFTFLTMKLFAFRDRLEDVNKEFGRYHSLDLYVILATTTEQEWKTALKMRDQNDGELVLEEAGQIVSKCFSTLECVGMIRMRESPYYRPQMQLDDFMSALQELFPVRI